MQQLAFNFEQLEQAMISPLSGVELDDVESFIASLLLEASAAQPMTSDYLMNQTQTALDAKINLRRFHNIIRKLRKTHGLPILSRRTKPMGYWWCQSVAEMNEFIDNFRSQALDELHTLSRIVRKNYPLLAGQLTFRDVEIQEEINVRYES